MRTFTKFSLRFAAYLLVVGYLAGDLFVFNGPLSRHIQARKRDSPESIAEAKANGVVARVFNHQITRRQLDFAIYERLWLEGKELTDLKPEAKKLVSYAALGELIDHELIRVKVKVNTLELPVSDEEIAERIKRFSSKFETQEDLQTAMKTMGIADETALRNRIAARIQQEKYVAMRVDTPVKASEQEINDFYQAHEQDLALPERIRVSHIFIATLDKPSEEAKGIFELALTKLTAKETDFATLAKELSVDTATKDKAGDLGWMSRNRLPVDFAESVFPLPENTPTLIRTKLGWHIVVVTARAEAKLRSFQDCREEIIDALKTVKRQEVVSVFRTNLRLHEAAKIDIFHDKVAP